MTLLRITIFGGFVRMKKSRIKYLFFFIACIGSWLLACPVISGQIIINSKDQFEFAGSCMEKGEHEQAAREFERFIYFFPDDLQIKTARCLKGICYLKNRNYEEARTVFSQIIKSSQGSPMAGRGLFLTGESYYQEGYFKEAGYYYGLVIEQYPMSDLKNSALYRLGWSNMHKNRWQDASAIFKKVEEKSLLYKHSQQLADQSLQGDILPFKNPYAAGTLAALAPGLGHAYVSRYKDSAVAFLLNGLFIWAAVESFHQHHDVLGCILAFLEAGWYSGNIYSAVNVAHKHNRKLQNDFRGGLKDVFSLHLFSQGGDCIGMSLKFQF